MLPHCTLDLLCLLCSGLRPHLLAALLRHLLLQRPQLLVLGRQLAAGGGQLGLN